MNLPAHVVREYLRYLFFVRETMFNSSIVVPGISEVLMCRECHDATIQVYMNVTNFSLEDIKLKRIEEIQSLVTKDHLFWEEEKRSIYRHPIDLEKTANDCLKDLLVRDVQQIIIGYLTLKVQDSICSPFCQYPSWCEGCFFNKKQQRYLNLDSKKLSGLLS